MRHPDFESLLRVSRGAAESPARDAAHVESCPQCAAMVAWATGVRAAADAVTTFAAPPTAWEGIEERLERGERLVLPTGAGRVRRRLPAAAAAAVFVLAAGAAAALVPQTGVRAWIERHLGDARDVTAPAPQTGREGASAQAAGLTLPLADGRMHIALIAPAGPLQLRVRITNETELEVHASGGAADAQFVAAAGGLEITGAAAGEISLSIPRDARLVTVDVDGVRILEIREARLSVFGLEADTVGAEVILPLR